MCTVVTVRHAAGGAFSLCSRESGLERAERNLREAERNAAEKRQEANEAQEKVRILETLLGY